MSGGAPRVVALVVPAAGAGTRLGGGTPKALRLLRGRTLLEHALVSLLDGCAGAGAGAVDVLVAAPTASEALADVADVVHRTVSDPGRAVHPRQVHVVPGGATRQESVRRALDALEGDVDAVLVSDAARPLVPAEVVGRVLARLEDGAVGVVPVVGVVDTVREVDAAGRAVRLVDRSRLRAVQTPQGFDRTVLVAAHAAATADGVDATDDAALLERVGTAVEVVDGHPLGLKVTGPLDLRVAEALLDARAR